MNFNQSLIATASMYGKTMSEFEIACWQDDLSRFDDETKIRALKDHRNNPDNGQFMPKIADITKLIEGDTKDKAHIAWSKAFRAIRTHGQYTDVCFDDGHIHSTIEEMGGWTKFCLMEADDISFNTHRFKELYQTNSRTGKPHPRFLVGVAGETNRLAGMPVEQPTPIGSKEACRLVYKNGGSYRSTPTGGNALADVTKKLLVGAPS